jgi:hypothetical protein
MNDKQLQDSIDKKNRSISRYDNYMWFIAGLVIGAGIAGFIVMIMVKSTFVDNL